VTVSGSGGTVKVNNEQITANPMTYSFDTEVQVKFEAFAEPGYRFVRWSGTGVGSTENPITVDINCDTTIQAAFDPITPVLTIEKHGGGSISPTSGQYTYLPGTVINLKATPNKGWKFDGWSSNVSNPTSPITSLTLNSDMLVTASFSRIWPIWMIAGIIIGAMIIIGGIFWFVFRRRKKVKNRIINRKQVKNNILNSKKEKNYFLPLLRSSNTSFVIRLILGGIFIFTGFAKINHISALISEINQYQILSIALGSIFGHVLPYLEILVGVLLVLGIILRISAGVGGLMLISFAVAKIVAMVRGLDIKVCNCFGPAVPMLSTQSLAIDIVMLLLVIQIIVFRKELFSIPGWMRRRNIQNEDWPKRRNHDDQNEVT
jgi:hypothetical protein